MAAIFGPGGPIDRSFAGGDDKIFDVISNHSCVKRYVDYTCSHITLELCHHY